MENKRLIIKKEELIRKMYDSLGDEESKYILTKRLLYSLTGDFR